MEWSNYEQLRIVGWLRQKPIENDEIQFKMITSSNKEVMTRFIVTNVKHADGVHDMFFATIKPFGYVGKSITNRGIKEATK